MKKRIIAAALAAVLFFGIAAETKKAVAAPAIIAVEVIGILAVELLAMMNGAYDDQADSIGFILKNGVEGFEKSFIGTDECPSWLSTGWNTIYHEVENLINSGDITIDESGQADLDYQTYLKLCQSLAAVQDLEFNFGTVIPFFTFSYPINHFAVLQGVPHTPSFYSKTGSSYIPVFYNDTDIYFSYTYIFACLDDSGNLPYLSFCNRLVNSALNGHVNKGGVTGTNGAATTPEKAYSFFKPQFCFLEDGTQMVSYSLNGNTDTINQLTTTGYLHYNGSVKETVSSVPDGLTSGYVCCDGTSQDFLKSMTTYKVSGNGDVDDLSNVLPLDLTDNPGFSINTTGEITDVPYAVYVTDVPGVADSPLAEYLEEVSVDVDIDIPSIIIQKFPFCIPYDFYRFISCLCAEPQPPVFRIPISTNPYGDNNEFIYDILYNNETVRDYSNGNHLFEIDEEIVLDLSVIPLLQPISYTIFILGFILLLIFITPKMIQH